MQTKDLKALAALRGFASVADWRRQFRAAQAHLRASLRGADRRERARLTAILKTNESEAKTLGLFTK